MTAAAYSSIGKFKSLTYLLILPWTTSDPGLLASHLAWLAWLRSFNVSNLYLICIYKPLRSSRRLGTDCPVANDALPVMNGSATVVNPKCFTYRLCSVDSIIQCRVSQGHSASHSSLCSRPAIWGMSVYQAPYVSQLAWKNTAIISRVLLFDSAVPSISHVFVISMVNHNSHFLEPWVCNAQRNAHMLLFSPLISHILSIS